MEGMDVTGVLKEMSVLNRLRGRRSTYVFNVCLLVAIIASKCVVYYFCCCLTADMFFTLVNKWTDICFSQNLPKGEFVGSMCWQQFW